MLEGVAVLVARAWRALRVNLVYRQTDSFMESVGLS